MKANTLSLVAFATSSVAFFEPLGHEFRHAGPFDSK